MDKTEDRLVECFSLVFPDMSPERIRSSNAVSSQEWDSLAAVTLVAVVQEEFKVHIDLVDLPDLDSFKAFQIYLGRHMRPCEADGN